MVFTKTKTFGKKCVDANNRYSVRNPQYYSSTDVYMVFASGDYSHPLYRDRSLQEWYGYQTDAEDRAMAFGHIRLRADMSVWELERRCDLWRETATLRSINMGTTRVPPVSPIRTPSTPLWGRERSPVARSTERTMFDWDDIDAEDCGGDEEDDGLFPSWEECMKEHYSNQAGEPKNKRQNPPKVDKSPARPPPWPEPTGWVTTPGGRELVYENQSGEVSVESFTSSLQAFMSATAHFSGSRCETVFMYIIHLLTLKDWKQFSTGIVCFVSSLLDKGVLGLINAILATLAGDAAQVQASEEVCFTSFAAGVRDFGCFKKTPLFQSVHKVIAVCLSAAVVETDFSTKYPRFYKRVVDSVSADKYDCLDIMQLLLETTLNVWNVARDMMISRSIAPLLGSAGINAIEEEHAHIVSRHPRFLNGTYKDTYREDPLGFLGRVAEHTTRVRALHKGATGPDRVVLARYLAQVVEIGASINSSINRRKVRPMPFGVKLLGTTGIGKSAITPMMVRDLLRIAGLPCEDQYIAYVNTMEKFMSTVQNHTLAVIMDDLSQSKPEMGASSDMSNIIELLNNACNPVLKADLADKGNVFHNSRIVFATTNVAGLHASVQVSEPSAIMRRWCHLRMRVAEGYELRGHHEGQLRMLDPARVAELGIAGAHQFQILSYVPLARKSDETHDDDVIPVTDGDSDDRGVFRATTEWLSYSELMQTLAVRVREHFERQEEFMLINEADAQRSLCVHGFTTEPYCHLCAANEAALGTVQAGDLAARRGSFFSSSSESDSGSDSDESDRSVRDLNELLGRTADLCAEAEVADPAGVNVRLIILLGRCCVDLASTLDTLPPGEALRWVAVEYELCAAHYKRLQMWQFGPGTMLSDAETWPRREVERVKARKLPWVAATWKEGLRLKVENIRVWAISSVATSSYATAGFVQRRLIEAAHYLREMATPAPIPEPVWLTRILAKFGALDASDRLFLSHPRAVVAFGLIGVPVAFACLASVAMSLLCVPGVLSSPLTFVGSWAVAYWAAHQIIKTCQARMVSLTLTEARNRVRSATDRYFGKAVIALMAAIPLYLAANRLRRRYVGSNSYGVQGGGLTSGTIPPDPSIARPSWVKRPLLSFNYTDGKARTMTPDQIKRKLERGVFLVDVFYSSGSVVRTHALMVCTDHAIFPSHNLFRPDGSQSLVDRLEFRQTTETKGPVFSVKVGASNVIRLSTDMVLINTSAGGSMCDLTSFFVDGEERLSEIPVVEYSRNMETCEIEMQRYMAHTAFVNCRSHNLHYPGYEYERKTPTFVGLCGAIQVVDERFPKIVGMHTMGVTGDVRGSSCRISRSEILDAIAQMRGQCTTWGPAVSQHTTRHHRPPGYDHEARLIPLAEKSVLRESAPGTPLLPLGTFENYPQVRPKTELVVSPWEGLVTQCCGETRKHEPPSNLGKATVEKKKLLESAVISQLCPDTLALAVKDRYDEIESLVRATPDLLTSLKPLSEMEACSGVMQCAFANRLNTGTSAGWPYTGPKLQLMEPCPTPDQPDAIHLKPHVRIEIEELEQRMSTLERVNLVFKAGQKDEAVKIGKEKVRVFEASPFALTYLTRKYFLGVMRVFSAYPLETGSAVGINASGVDWNWLQRHLASYNPTELVIGDWRHFDTSEAYQEIMAVFGMYIRMASDLGQYSDADINIMWVIAQEIGRHYVLIKGDLCIMEGTNPSGNGLTVFINNDCNALRMRCAFYALALQQATHDMEREGIPAMHTAPISFGGYRLPIGYRSHLEPLMGGLKGRFADYIAEAYYGDDFLLAPLEGKIAWFNQVSISQWFASQGKEITSVTKGPVVDEFTPWEGVDFLKRRFRWDEELRVYMGPLAMDSIYKPLFVVPKSPAYALEFHYAELIKSATRELFLHGREEFDRRVPGLSELALKIGASDYMVGYPGFEYEYHSTKYLLETREHMLDMAAALAK